LIVDITNEILKTIKTDIPTATVLTSYPSVPPKFPCIIFEESSIDTFTESIDSSGEKHNELSFEINIFSDAQDRVSQVKTIRNLVDNIMGDLYRMTRITSQPVPNYLNASIYRYNLRYNCVVDSTKKIFRR
jgi:hypothetical protein